MPTKEQIIEALKVVYDPELGVNVVDLGLIYDVDVIGSLVRVEMTLTTQGCPLHDSIAVGIERALQDMPGVEAVQVDLVWNPPWSLEKLTSEGRKALGYR